MIINPHMLPKIRSKKIMEAASGQPCSLRIASFAPNRACSGANTTVGAHLPVFGKGVSTKVTDMAVAFACSACHDILDGRDAETWRFILDQYPTALMERLLMGLVETHARLIVEGVIQIPDGRII